MAKATQKPRSKKPAGERVMLGLRVTPELKRQLDEAARGSGRSQSQEAEFRLERSFQTAGLLEEALSLAYGPLLAGILVHVGDEMQAHGWVWSINNERNPERRHWLDHPDGYRVATLAALRVFDAVAPVGDRQDDKALREQLAVQVEALSQAGLGGRTLISKIVDTAKLMRERHAPMLEKLRPLPGEAKEARK